MVWLAVALYIAVGVGFAGAVYNKKPYDPWAFPALAFMWPAGLAMIVFQTLLTTTDEKE